MQKLYHSPLVLVIAALSFAGTYNDVPHYDHRATPHLQFSPAYANKAALRGADQARDFLSTNASLYGFASDLNDLTLVREQTSLLATHYHFQQTLAGTPVQGGEIVVSIDHETKSISRVYNNIFPVGQDAQVASAANLDRDDAYDIAWTDIAVHGELLAEPKAELVFIPEGKNFTLVWQVDLGVEAPFGYWRAQINAANGRMLSLKETSLSRKTVPDAPEKYFGQLDERTASFARFAHREAQRLAERESRKAAALKASGTAKTFDPDPRTTLNDISLTDSSPASAFTPAYVSHTLDGLEQSGGVYRLNGPWITIIDWETPTTAPSTTPDGNWTAERGNNAFNDANTYFHIHQNQEYIQSLGFTGATGIQEVSIETDSDGFQGQDNSHYISGSNRMAFGHGCVDDNEDVDVILHEYGHAIHYSINNNWGGGDARAIGEGFGDYWAGSYSYSTPNGPVFNPNWAFSWDGHGSCWGGRLLNLTNLIYDPNVTYTDHQPIPGGSSDELWSAPIFQSLVDLVDLGRPISEVDRIILESHFGLGSGVTMRILGNTTVATAQALQGSLHASVFTTRFLAQNIIDIPHVSLAASNSLISNEPGENGEADPGETVDLKLRVQNMGNLLASSLTATLTSNDPNVTIVQGDSNYPDLGVGASDYNLTDYTITLDSNMACGDSVNLSLEVHWSDTSRAPGSTTLNFTLTTGVAIGASNASSPGLAITDNTTVTDTLAVTGTSAQVTANLNVDINITHTYIGDLLVTLRAPDGTEVILHNRTGSDADDIVGNYPLTLVPAQSLASLIGKNLDGNWQLSINDNGNGDVGVLNSWGITDITGYTCEEALPFCLGDINGDRVVDGDDLGVSMEGWNSANGDVNGNGLGDIIDLIDILESYGICP